VEDNIIILKLAYQQTIDLVVHCTKGIGRDHTKWSPVATATYRILPSITFKQQLTELQAKQLKSKCPMGVFDIEDGKVLVKYPRKCTLCRECIRETGWTDLIQLARVKEHFIFSIESTGCIPPAQIFKEALGILNKKCKVVDEALSTLGN